MNFMDEIKLSITVIRHFTYDELFEYNDSIIGRTGPPVSRISRLQSRFDSYIGAQTNFDLSVKKSAAAPETPIIRELDTQRKGVFQIIDDFVRKNAQYSVLPAMKTAALALLPLFNLYAGTPRIDYEGETGAIKNLIQELEKPENVAHIATLGLTAHVESLKQINLDFQAKYEERMQNRYDFKQDGTTRERSRAVIDELVKFCKVVDGLLLSAADPAEIADLRLIVSIINSTMEQYSRIVHQRLGIIAAKKKHDKENEGKGDGKEDGGTQTPDTTNPPPNTPQNPDTTNPPAPDLPPQTPGNNTPPTIDPDELNPPAVGEH